MKFALALLACIAAINTTNAQTSVTVLVQDSTSQGSFNGLMSTSFVGLKLPSGGGAVYITIAPGDLADGSLVTSYADHTQAGSYWYDGSSTSFGIGSTGHYWMYLSQNGGNGPNGPNNFDYLEIRVEASTYVGTVTCTYCAAPTGWGQGWPPLGTHQETGVVHVVSQAGPPTSAVPRWVVPVLGVVIGIATLVPLSYCIYRRHQNKRATAFSSTDESLSTSVELQTTSAV